MQQNTNRPTRAGHVPPSDLTAKVRALVDESGVLPTARALELAEATTAKLAAGMRVTRGTIALARAKLAELEAARAA